MILKLGSGSLENHPRKHVTQTELEFEGSSFGSTPLGSICSLGSTVALRELTIWGALWTTAGYPEPIELYQRHLQNSTKDT